MSSHTSLCQNWSSLGVSSLGSHTSLSVSVGLV